jgi:hypothetical protein
LQLKEIWGLWDYRDLPLGDTASYFAVASLWYRDRHVDFAWSPLYTVFYGWFLSFSKDACLVTSLHRVVIVLLAVVLVLAVLRQMVPHPIAWLTAAWWATLAINHNTVTEVHLFALLPILLAWLVILRWPGRWGRGIGLALFLAAALLVHNEWIVAVVSWAAFCVVRERGERREASAAIPVPLRAILVPYVLPAALALGLAGWFYSRSIFRGAALAAQFETKHSLNMAQVYAFGFQQRHPEWVGDPWLGYANLCRRDFGTPEPSFGQMLLRGPRAAGEHLVWNLKLLPSGVQLLLFDDYAGSFSPDYGPTTPMPVPAMRNSAIVLALVGIGAVLLWRRRRWWWENWLRPRADGWAAMLAALVVACLVIPTQRPRPSYLFAQGVVLMTVVATSGFVVMSTLFRRRPGAGPLASGLMPAAMLVLPVVVHSRYAEGLPLLARRAQMAYHELLPFQDSIAESKAVLVDQSLAEPFSNYLGQGRDIFIGYQVLQERALEEPLAAFLDRKGISFFHVNEACWAQLEADEPGVIQSLIDSGPTTGWWLVGFQDTVTRWLLFRRAPGPPTTHAAAAGAPPWRASGAARGFEPPPAAAMYKGLRYLGGLEGPLMVNAQFDPHLVRFGLWPVTRLAPGNTVGGKCRLILKGVAATPGQTLTVLLDGQPLGTYPWPGTTMDDMHEITIPLDLSAGQHAFELSYAVPDAHRRTILFWKMQLVTQ